MADKQASRTAGVPRRRGVTTCSSGRTVKSQVLGLAAAVNLAKLARGHHDCSGYTLLLKTDPDTKAIIFAKDNWHVSLDKYVLLL